MLVVCSFTSLSFFVCVLALHITSETFDPRPPADDAAMPIRRTATFAAAELRQSERARDTLSDPWLTIVAECTERPCRRRRRLRRSQLTLRHAVSLFLSGKLFGGCGRNSLLPRHRYLPSWAGAFSLFFLLFTFFVRVPVILLP